MQTHIQPELTYFHWAAAGFTRGSWVLQSWFPDTHKETKTPHSADSGRMKQGPSAVACCLYLVSVSSAIPGLLSPQIFHLPQGCRRRWMWSPQALHIPCKGRNRSEPRDPVGEEMQPKLKLHTLEPWLWNMVRRHKLRALCRLRVHGLDARRPQGTGQGHGTLPSSLVYHDSGPCLQQWQLQDVLAG